MSRLSVASRDSGAESPVYDKAPRTAANIADLAAGPPPAGGGSRGPGPTSARPALGRRLAPRGSIGAGGAARCLAVAAASFPPGGAARGTTVTAAPRLAATYDMSVVDPQSGRWYVKDVRASNAADGNPMTWFASSLAMPRAPRSRRELTDAHGREG